MRIFFGFSVGTLPKRELLSIVVDGVKELHGYIRQKWGWFYGMQTFDKRTNKWELLEGIKEKRVGENHWERGRFGYIRQLKRYELVEGVKSINGKKTRAKWIFYKKENKMKGVKVVKKCALEKCERNSENSRREFKLCGKCKKQFYCSRRHQRNHWKCHKYVCSYY